MADSILTSKSNSHYHPDTKELFQPAVTVLNEIQAFYTQYETPQTKEMLSHLITLRDELRGEGVADATFVGGGSIAFGQAGEKSDYDILYAGDTTWYGGLSAGIWGLANLHPILTEKLSTIVGKPVKVCKQLMNWEFNLSKIDSELKRGFATVDDVIKSKTAEFYERYPLNLAIDDSLEPIYDKINQLRNTQEHVDIGLRRGYIADWYGQSFLKYHQRLAKRGIDVPEEIFEKEMQLIGRCQRDKFYTEVELIKETHANKSRK